MPHSWHATEFGDLRIHEAVRIVKLSLDGYVGTFHDLKFLVTLNKEKDERLWLHSSVSRRDRKTPTYDDLLDLRKYTTPINTVALQVFPPEDEYVHEVIKGQIPVLHLWTCLEGRVTPDFRGSYGGI